MAPVGSEQHVETIPGSPWLDVVGAAAYMNLARGAVYREVRRGKIKAAHVGARGQLRFHRSWLDAYLDMCAGSGRR